MSQHSGLCQPLLALLFLNRFGTYVKLCLQNKLSFSKIFLVLLLVLRINFT